MQRLSQALWHQRELLGLLEHASADTDVASAQHELRRTEILRAVAADEAAGAVGLAPNASLAELGARLGGPWGEILADHRAALASTERVLQPSLLDFLRS